MAIEVIDDGDYQIIASTQEAHEGGFYACLTIDRVKGVSVVPVCAYGKRTVFPDNRFETEALALRYAIGLGLEIVRERPQELSA